MIEISGVLSCLMGNMTNIDGVVWWLVPKFHPFGSENDTSEVRLSMTKTSDQNIRPKQPGGMTQAGTISKCANKPS